MWSRNKTPDNQPSGQDDPLNQFNASTVRRKIDQDVTQPLDPQNTPPNEAEDFGNRRRDRLERQTGPLAGGSRVYPTNMKTFVQNVNNRQLFVIGGVILLLLVSLLVLRNINKSASKAKGTTASATATSRTTATTTSLFLPDSTSTASAGFITLPTTSGIGNSPDGQATATKSFVVFNTGSLGLKVHDKPTVNATTIATFPDGTKVDVTSTSEQQADGHTWVKVKGPQGEGWVAKDWLQASQ